MKNSLTLISLILSLLFTSCGSVQEHRIRHKKSTYENATNEQQEAMFNGKVLYGFSELMVYIAMGEPRAIQQQSKQIKWYYLGIGNTVEDFKTTMDLIFSSAKNYKMLEVEFYEAEVKQMKIKEIDYALLQRHPNKHSPANRRF